MKFILHFSLFLFAVSASADSEGLAIQDKTSLHQIKTRLEATLDGRDFVIKEYSRAWTAYNPMSAIVDPDRTYRTIVFEFTDKNGSRQKFYCDFGIVRGSADISIYDCEGGSKRIGDFHKMRKYYFFGDSIMVGGVINAPSQRSSGGSSNTAE